MRGGAMKLWMALYAMIWIVFFEFLLAMTPGGGQVLGIMHAGLGFAIIGIAYYNFDGVRRTAVPGRVKRTAKASFDLSIVMAVLGVLLILGVGREWAVAFGVTVWGLILFLHVVNALAIITQAAAVAIAYDMWEDKEFAMETTPGEVTARPDPAAATPSARS